MTEFLHAGFSKPPPTWQLRHCDMSWKGPRKRFSSAPCPCPSVLRYAITLLGQKQDCETAWAFSRRDLGLLPDIPLLSLFSPPPVASLHDLVSTCSMLALLDLLYAMYCWMPFHALGSNGPKKLICACCMQVITWWRLLMEQKDHKWR